jgi:ferrous-iron efflux pump FieF
MAAPITTAEREQLLKLATYASVGTAALLICAKLVAYWYSDSVSILASLVDSLMDGGASLLNLLAVRYALAPPDAQHRFGHGKAESLAALAQAMFIAGSGLFLIMESSSRLVRPRPLEDIGLGLIVMVAAMVVTLILQAVQHHVISRTDSSAIRADALHYRMDLLTNAAIIAALLFARQGWEWTDPVFALAIAGYILYSAWHIGEAAFHHLLDRELPEATRTEIIRLATSHPEVAGLHDLRTRLSGPTAFIQLHLDLDRNLSLAQAHRISDEVEAAILRAFPAADVVIHQDPVAVAAVVPIADAPEP